MLVDLVKFAANSTGTGAITPGSAVSGYRGVEALQAGAEYSYSIQQESSWEIGSGTYLAAQNVFVRSPRASSEGGVAINLQPNASVALVALVDDLIAIAGGDQVNPSALAAEIARATSVEAFLSSRIVAAAIGIATYETVAAMNADMGKPVGTFAIVSENDQFYRYETGGWVPDDAFRAALVSFVQPLVDQAQAAANQAADLYAAAQAGLSYPVSATVGSSPNEWVVTLPDGVGLVDRALYRLFAPSSPTGAISILGDGANALRYDNGLAVGLEARIVQGFEVVLRWDGSPGQLFRFASAQSLRISALEADPDPFAPFRKAIAFTPYGMVAQGGDGNAVFTPISLGVLGNGSSVNTPITTPNTRAGGAIPGTEPSAVLASLFNGAFGPGVTMDNGNTSRGGTTVNEFPAQRAEVDPAVLANALATLQIPGMNDFAAGGYNTGGTFPGGGIRDYETYLISEIVAGRRVWLATSPTYHIGRSPDRERIPSGTPQIWPYGVDAPVSDTQQVPPFVSSLITLDRTGNGIPTRGSKRYDHGNNLLRDVARRLAYRYPGMVVLIDADHSFWVNGIEPQLTPTSTDAQRIAAYDVIYEDPAFSPGSQFAHPGTYGQRVSYGMPIAEMVDAMRGAPNGKWWFRGDRT